MVYTRTAPTARPSAKVALHYLRRYEEAIKAYDNALTIDENYVSSWNDKGRALHNLKRYIEAIQAYDRALTLDPNSASARKGRSIALQLSTLCEGATIKGVVKIVTEHDAFVDLGGVDGLLHITDMAWRRLKHPSEVVNIGDEVTTKVLKIDTNKNRILLGLKQLGEDPWVGISRRYPTIPIFRAVTPESSGTARPGCLKI